MAVILSCVALCWVAAAVIHATYIQSVAAQATDLGVTLPGWLLAFAAVPMAVWLIPALFDGGAALFAPRLSENALRTIATATFLLVIAYAFCGFAMLYYVGFA